MLPFIQKSFCLLFGQENDQMKNISINIFSIGLLALFLCSVLACSNDDMDSENSGIVVYQSQRKALKKNVMHSPRTTDIGLTYPSKTPIQDAFQLINLDKNNLNLPQAFKNNYIMLARLPFIDRISKSPFIFQNWADELSTQFQNSISIGTIDIFDLMLTTLDGSVLSTNLNNKSPKCSDNLTDAYRYLYRLFGLHPDKSAIQNIREAGFTPGFDQQLAHLICHFTHAAILTKEAYSDLSSDELESLSTYPEQYFYNSNNHFNFLTASTHAQSGVVSVARKIKFKRLFTAFKHLSTALDSFIQFNDDSLNGDLSDRKIFTDEQSRSGHVLSLPSPIGEIKILGSDDNVYSGNAALIIDLGGNDWYKLNDRMKPLIDGRISLLVDISGDDKYESRDVKVSQGAGVTSIDILADLSGNDRYIAGDIAQGCGIYGIGMLLDSSGDDVYEMGVIGQGFAVIGMGLLVDRKGSDRYKISGMGQGAGSTLGFGGLIDGSGNDVYHADLNPDRSKLKLDHWSHAQGTGISVRSPDWRRNFSLYGGIGFLSDGSGDDIYKCSGGNCMGAGYFMSAGALVDHSGNDRYYPYNGNGMGFAVHHASGILIDKEGNDTYFAKNDSGGVGADYSIGFLADYQGNDIYGPIGDTPIDPDNNHRVLKDHATPTENAMAKSSYASASRSKGLGILIDYNGDDRYFAQRGIRSASCGAVIPPPDPRDWSHALLIDLGGNDTYHPLNRRDNHYHIDLDHGVSYDVDISKPGQQILSGGKRVVEKIPDTLMGQNATIPNRTTNEILQLADLDNFSRFEGIGRILLSNPDIIDTLIEVLKSSQNTDLNLSLVEVLNHFILQKKMNRTRARHFEGLLRARDPEVRIYAARTLGMWNVSRSASAMVDALKVADPEVREHVMWAVGKIGKIDDLKELHEITMSQTSNQSKRQVAHTFLNILERNKKDRISHSGETKKVLLSWIVDPDTIVRKEAAVGLRYLESDQDVIHALSDSLLDRDVYVRRASATSLALLGVKEGLPVLIDSLKFPSIDTNEYYDKELVKDLAFFCGTDFTGSIRYNYRTWKDWWDKNGHTVDINENLAIMNHIQTAFYQDNEIDGMKIFDRLLVEYPENIVIKFRYKKFCQDWITFRLLTQERITPNILKRCLRLQKKIVELSPKDSYSRAELASFYMRLSRSDDAIAMMESAIQMAPENHNYHRRLEYYKSRSQSRVHKNQ